MICRLLFVYWRPHEAAQSPVGLYTAGQDLQYLLNLDHPEGGGKARVLHANGFSEANALLLAMQLLHIARNEPVIRVEPDDIYGPRYVIRGPLLYPSGKSAIWATVWIVPINEGTPRFVTAYLD